MSLQALKYYSDFHGLLFNYNFHTMQEFFDNVSRYPRYLISFSLGVFYNAMEPLLPFLKKPATAIPLIGAVIATFIGLVFIMRGMLGIA